MSVKRVLLFVCCCCLFFFCLVCVQLCVVVFVAVDVFLLMRPLLLRLPCLFLLFRGLYVCCFCWFLVVVFRLVFYVVVLVVIFS